MRRDAETTTYFARVGLDPLMPDTVTPQREIGSKSGMNLVGWLIAIPIAFLLLPLLPLYLLVKLIGAVRGEQEPR